MESATGAGGPSGESPGKRERARQITLIALAVLALVFALLNSREVKVNFILTTTRAPLIVVVAACVAVGLAIGSIAARRQSDR
jgi:uncharacterized integral membrane protein